MQLSKLEIKGFKSFGDKVVVNFDDGITGIVGPNGCGKSNIVDSIRWVLGEQKTKALRSDKMENVIFNGTKNRKPLQLAEVSLSFNNTKNLLPLEYTEVTITRRYYRSGESEYLLNGVPCRLKDITNLFLDTGIGSDSYAIIELKMVDEILNDKDNSRRNLFEEAAGISKFKVRKKQTLKKLSDTDKDLERVEDLLFEIEKNLKSLERQAKQAEKYLKVKEEYKEHSVNLAKVSIEKQRESFESVQKQLEELTDLKTVKNKELASNEALVQQLKADLVKKEKLLASRQKTLNEHINKIRQYESDKKIRGERLRFLTDRSANLKERIGQDKLNNERTYVELKTLGEEKLSAQKIAAEIESRVKILQEEHLAQKEQTNVMQEELNVVNNNYRQRQEEFYQLKKSLEINELQLEKLKDELNQTSSDSTQQSENLEQLQENLKVLAGDLNNKEKELQQFLGKEEKLSADIEKGEAVLEEIKDTLTKQNRELDSKQNEYNLTKSLVDNLEGFPEAIKFLKQNSAWGKDALLLSDVLTTDEKFRVSIENYLESVMNYYIVDDVAQAYQAVNLLQESAKGKANFFVLDSFSNFKASKAAKVKNAVAAVDIVEYDKKYDKLVKYVLDNVYLITDDSEVIPEQEGVIFITQSGKVTKRKHSISGGSVGLFEGKRIGRAKNLEKLDKIIQKLSKERDQTKTKIDRQLNEINKLKASTHKEAIENARTAINESNENYIESKLKQEQLSSLLDNNSSKTEDFQKNIKILEEGIEKSRPKLELMEVETTQLLENINQLSNELTFQNEILSQKSNAFNQENIRFHQQQNKIQSVDQEESYKNSITENTAKRIDQNTVELQKTDEEIKGLLEHSEDSDDALLAMYEEKDEIEKGVNEAEKDYYKSRGDIDETEQKSKDVQRQRENNDTITMDLQNRLNETKLSLASIKERLSVEFDVNIDQLLISDDDGAENSESEESLQDKVDAVKQKLDRMGPINPMAMEAYEEIKERHDFITEQRKDLAEAKESLLATIKEIDDVARENFLESFEKIKENFVEVFRSLFTEEDKCNLKLSDPDNPLESQIEILAQPKGKRPLTINQLSGGEKTLTAVALLFAIYLIKPAPFCIFDEVDAPLDDANIDKFNNIIREFSKDSQFILVTHNKRTMATTDVIYGVTMQETGVSKLVPVDLRSLSDQVE